MLTSSTRSLPIVMLIQLAVIGCCKGKHNGDNRQGNDPPKQPPVLILDSSGANGKHVGDSAFVKWKSSEPVEWGLVAQPLGWKLEVVSETEVKVAGRFEMGASQTDEKASVRAKSKATGLSTTGETSVRALIRVVDRAKFKLVADQGITEIYLVDVTAETPPWNDSSRGKVRVEADTSGLSNPGGGPVPDKIIVANDEQAGNEWENKVAGPCTKTATIEDEEKFSLTGEPAKKTFANGMFKVVLANHPAPPPGNCDSDDELVRVKVVFE